MTDQKKFRGCAHVQSACDRKTRKEIVNQCVRDLWSHRHKFSAVAVTGYSASILGASVATLMNKDIIVIRKESEDRNSGFDNEGYFNVRAVFIDDLSCTGETIERINDGLNDLDAKLYGVWLAHSSGQDGDFCYSYPIKTRLLSNRDMIPFC